MEMKEIIASSATSHFAKYLALTNVQYFAVTGSLQCIACSVPTLSGSEGQNWGPQWRL